MKLLLLLLAFVSLAAATEHSFFNFNEEESQRTGNACCLPKQWEGRVGAFFMKKRIIIPKIRMSDSKVGIDYANQIMAARSMTFCPYKRKIYRARSVVNFKTKKAYAIFGGKCKIYSISANLPDNCIPSSFTKLQPYFYGAGSSSLTISPFGLRNSRLEYFIALASGNCAPVKGAFRTRSGKKTKTIGKYQYYNVTIGNTDAELYKVPANCTPATEGESGWRASIRRLTILSEHPMANDSDLSAAMHEPLAVVHSMLSSHANAVLNERSRCRWCRNKARRWAQMARERWTRFRAGMS